MYVLLYLLVFVSISFSVTYLSYREEIDSWSDFWSVLRREYKGATKLIILPLLACIVLGMFL
jgi:hypothetical protein